eukprot:GEMP01000107.1.p1 GENE.GEMP01000107.1~~GEMP01000107.1.p1  ORF type:complete len:3117 (+),score=623.91 GEMP01000107.1:1020-9353(+)
MRNLEFKVEAPTDFTDAKDNRPLRIIPNSVTLEGNSSFTTTLLSKKMAEDVDMTALESGIYDRVMGMLPGSDARNNALLATKFEGILTSVLPLVQDSGFQFPEGADRKLLPKETSANSGIRLTPLCESSSSNCDPYYITSGTRCVEPLDGALDNCKLFDRPFPREDSPYYNLSPANDYMQRTQTILRDLAPLLLRYISASSTSETDEITFTKERIVSLLQDAELLQQTDSESEKSITHIVVQSALDALEHVRIEGLRAALGRTVLWDGNSSHARQSFIDLSGIALEVAFAPLSSLSYILPASALVHWTLRVEIATWTLKMTTYILANASSMESALQNAIRTRNVRCMLDAIDTIAFSLQDGAISIGLIHLDVADTNGETALIKVSRAPFVRYLISQLATAYVHRQFAPPTRDDVTEDGMATQSTIATASPINDKLKKSLDNWRDAATKCDTKVVERDTEHDVTRLVTEALPLLPLVTQYVHQTVASSWSYDLGIAGPRISNVRNVGMLHLSHDVSAQQMQVRVGNTFGFEVESYNADASGDTDPTWRIILSFLGDIDVTSGIHVALRNAPNELQLYDDISCFVARLNPSVRVVNPRVQTPADVKLELAIGDKEYGALLLSDTVVNAALELVLAASVLLGPFDKLLKIENSCTEHLVAERTVVDGKFTPRVPPLEISTSASSGFKGSIVGADSVLQHLSFPTSLVRNALSSINPLSVPLLPSAVSKKMMWNAECVRLNVAFPKSADVLTSDASNQTPYVVYNEKLNATELFTDINDAVELEMDVCLRVPENALTCSFTLRAEIRINRLRLHALFVPSANASSVFDVRHIPLAALEVDIDRLCLRDVSSITEQCNSLSDSTKKMLRMTLATLGQQFLSALTTATSTATTASLQSDVNSTVYFPNIRRVALKSLMLLPKFSFTDLRKFLPTVKKEYPSKLVAWRNFSIISRSDLESGLRITSDHLDNTRLVLMVDPFSLTVDVQLLLPNSTTWYKVGFASEKSFNASSKLSMISRRSSREDGFYSSPSCLLDHVKMNLEHINLQNMHGLHVTVQPLGDNEIEKHTILVNMTDRFENAVATLVNSTLAHFVPSLDLTELLPQADENCFVEKDPETKHFTLRSQKRGPPSRTVLFDSLDMVEVLRHFTAQIVDINVVNAAVDLLLQNNASKLKSHIPLIKAHVESILMANTTALFMVPDCSLKKDGRFHIILPTSVTEGNPLRITLKLSDPTFTLQIGLAKLELHVSLESAMTVDILKKPDAWWINMCWMNVLAVDAFVPIVQLSQADCLLNSKPCNFSTDERVFISTVTTTFVHKTILDQLKSMPGKCGDLGDDQNTLEAGPVASTNDGGGIPQAGNWTNQHQLRWTQSPWAHIADTIVTRVEPATLDKMLGFPHRRRRVYVLNISSISHTFMNTSTPFARSMLDPSTHDPGVPKQLLADPTHGHTRSTVDARNIIVRARSDHHLIIESPRKDAYQLRGATVMNVTRVEDFDHLSKVLNFTTWRLLPSAKRRRMPTRFLALRGLHGIDDVELVQIRDRNTNKWYTHDNNTDLRAILHNITANYNHDGATTTFTFAHAWNAHVTALHNNTSFADVTLDTVTFDDLSISRLAGPLWNMTEDVVLRRDPRARMTYVYAHKVSPHEPRHIFMQDEYLHGRCVVLRVVPDAYVLKDMPVETMDGIYVPPRTDTNTLSLYSNGNFTLRRRVDRAGWMLNGTHHAEDGSLRPATVELNETDARIQRVVMPAARGATITFGNREVPLSAADGNNMTWCFTQIAHNRIHANITDTVSHNHTHITCTPEDERCFHLNIASDKTVLAIHDKVPDNNTPRIAPLLTFDVINAGDAAMGAGVTLNTLTVGIRGTYTHNLFGDTDPVPFEVKLSGNDVVVEAAAILAFFRGRFTLDYEQRMKKACRAKYYGDQSKMLTLVATMLLKKVSFTVGPHSATKDFTPTLYLTQSENTSGCATECVGAYRRDRITGNYVTLDPTYNCTLDVHAESIHIKSAQNRSLQECGYHIATLDFEQDLLRKLSQLLLTHAVRPRLNTLLAPEQIIDDTCPDSDFDLKVLKEYAHIFGILFSVFFAVASVCALGGLIGGTWRRWWDPQTTHILPNLGAMGSDPVVPAGVGIAIPLFIIATLCGLIASSFSSAGILKATWIIEHPTYGVQHFSTHLVHEFALWDTIAEMYQSGAYVLFVFILLGSGVLPYVKCCTMLYLWVAPPRLLSLRWRVRLVHFAHRVGKFALVDILFLNFFVHVFRVHLEFPVMSRDGEELRASLDMYCEPLFGFYIFYASTILSIACSFIILIFSRRCTYVMLQREWHTTSLKSNAQIVAFATLVQLASDCDDTKQRVTESTNNQLPVAPTAMKRRFTMAKYHQHVARAHREVIAQDGLPLTHATRPRHPRESIADAITDDKKKGAARRALPTKIDTVKNLARYYVQVVFSSTCATRTRRARLVVARGAHIGWLRYVAFERYMLPVFLVLSLVILLCAFLIETVSVSYGGMFGYMMTTEAAANHTQSGYTAQVDSDHNLYITTSRFYSMQEIGSKSAAASVYDYETQGVDFRVHVVQVLFFVITIVGPVMLLAIGMLLWYKPMLASEWYGWCTATAYIHAHSMFNMLALTVILELFSVEQLTEFMIGNNCDTIRPFLDQMFGDKFIDQCMTTKPNYTGWIAFLGLRGIVGMFCIVRLTSLIHDLNNLICASVKDPALPSDDERGGAVDYSDDGITGKPRSDGAVRSADVSWIESFLSSDEPSDNPQVGRASPESAEETPEVVHRQESLVDNI